MERIDRVIKNERYKEALHKISLWEQDRRFCRHDMAHFLDVCRLAEIDWLNACLKEQKESFEKRKEGTEAVSRELLYAAGLLHDIGRWMEYEKGIRHEKASGELAEEILRECGFKTSETARIIEAILAHRNKDIREENSLSGYLYRADKKSRACFACKVQKECSWPEEKKNLTVG